MNEFQRSTIAELAALRQLTGRLLTFASISVKHAGGDHNAYLATVLDAATRDIDLSDFPDLSADDASLVREMAKARLSLIVTGASDRTREG